MSNAINIETHADLARVVGLYAAFNASAATITGASNPMPVGTVLQQEAAAIVVVGKHAPNVISLVDRNSRARLNAAKAQVLRVKSFADEKVANRRIKHATHDFWRQAIKFAPKVA